MDVGLEQDMAMRSPAELNLIATMDEKNGDFRFRLLVNAMLGRDLVCFDLLLGWCSFKDRTELELLPMISGMSPEISESGIELELGSFEEKHFLKTFSRETISKVPLISFTVQEYNIKSPESNPIASLDPSFAKAAQVGLGSSPDTVLEYSYFL
jgi:hypothetical protein